MKEDTAVADSTFKALMGHHGSPYLHRGPQGQMLYTGYGATAAACAINGVNVPMTDKAPTAMSLISMVFNNNIKVDQLTQDRTFQGRSWQGDIAEVLVFDRTLNADELRQVGYYLSTKYGLATSYTAAYNPNPANNELQAEVIDVALEWEAISLGAKFDVYFGDSVAIMTKVASEISERTWNVGDLDIQEDYAWKIVTLDPNEGGVGYIEYAGDDWTFTTGGKAVMPSPVDGGDLHLAIDSQLSWSADAWADYVKVNFAEQGQTLTEIGPFTDSVLAGANLPAMEVGKTYQWRVDEYQNDVKVADGDLWTFTVTRESYAPITLGLKLHLAANDPNADGTVIDAGTIGGWNDLSVNGNDAVQIATGNAALTLNVVNGLPAVRFDGNGDYLELTEITGVKTVFWVLAEDADATLSFRPLLGHSGTPYFHRGPNGEMFYRGYGALNWGAPAGARIDGAIVPVTEIAPTDFAIVTLISASNLATDRIGQDRGWAERCWDGDIAEILVYDRILTADEVNIVQSYLADKYALTVASEYDFNADDAVNLGDFIPLSNAWMAEGFNWADFNRSGVVDADDLRDFVNQWLK